MNDLAIHILQSSHNSSYLGQVENFRYDGFMNKVRTRNEYLRRVKRIWSSDL